ncbi:CpaF family protein, partial [bacterium]|nr:CpaF family protein [bacterium]
MGLLDKLERARGSVTESIPGVKKQETQLTPVQRLKKEVHQRLVKDMDGNILKLEDEEEKRKLLTKEIEDRLIIASTENNISITRAEHNQIIEIIINEILGLGVLESLLQDPSVTEVMVNGPRQIYVERKGKLILTDVTFKDDDEVMHIIERIIAPLGRRCDESVPYVDARLKDGSRVNAIIPPLALNGPTITIRKFSKDPFQIQDLVRFGTLTQEMANFIDACVKARLNIVVAGGTGSGKTTTLNVLSSFIPDGERIITVEDAAELQLRQNHVIRLETRPPNVEGKGAVTIRDLVRNCLRMRPERIVVGECRAGEALDMLQAMNTGHDGSLTTAHANTPRDTLSRLETMVMMAGMDLPSKAIR